MNMRIQQVLMLARLIYKHVFFSLHNSFNMAVSLSFALPELFVQFQQELVFKVF